MKIRTRTTVLKSLREDEGIKVVYIIIHTTEISLEGWLAVRGVFSTYIDIPPSSRSPVYTNIMDGQAFPKSTLESARKAKLTMESFYDHLLVQDRDRTNRWKKLDLSMEEMGLSNDEVRGRRPLSSY